MIESLAEYMVVWKAIYVASCWSVSFEKMLGRRRKSFMKNRSFERTEKDPNHCWDKFLDSVCGVFSILEAHR